MKRQHRNYTIEFKQKALELSYSRGNVSEVCKEFRYSYFSFTSLASRVKNVCKNSFPGHGKPKLTDDQREIEILKRQLKDIKLEHDILKRATSIFPASDRKI